MVSMRGLAFLLGAAGLALFLGGILWALLTPPDSTCPPEDRLDRLACERQNYEVVLKYVMVVIFAGLVCEGLAVIMLMAHLAQKRPPPSRPPPPKDARTAPWRPPTQGAPGRNGPGKDP